MSCPGLILTLLGLAMGLALAFFLQPLWDWNHYATIGMLVYVISMLVYMVVWSRRHGWK